MGCNCGRTTKEAIVIEETQMGHVEIRGMIPTHPPGKWVWNHLGVERVILDLLPDGKIDGWRPHEQAWRMDGGNLVISGNGLDTVVLVWSDQESLWIGEYKWFSRGTVKMRPA